MLYRSLYHVLLPWHSTHRRVVVKFQILPLTLACDCCTVSATNSRHILHLCTISPFSRDNVVVVFFLVHDIILESRVPYPHQVMKTHARQHYVAHSVWLLPHCGEQTLESVPQDAKGIFHNLPSPR